MKKLIFLLFLTLSLNSYSIEWTKDVWYTQYDHAMAATVGSYMIGGAIKDITHWKWSYEAGIVGINLLGLYKEFYIDDKPSKWNIAGNVVGSIGGYCLNKFVYEKYMKKFEAKIGITLNINFYYYGKYQGHTGKYS